MQHRSHRATCWPSGTCWQWKGGSRGPGRKHQGLRGKVCVQSPEQSQLRADLMHLQGQEAFEGRQGCR